MRLAAAFCSARSCSRSYLISLFSRSRESSRPPPRTNSTMAPSSDASNHVPWPLHTSTMTPEHRAKLIRFINSPHWGHGEYRILLPSSFGSIWCAGAGDAAPSTAACSSRLAQIRLNDATSSQMPPQCSHSSICSPAILIEVISVLQRGHFRMESSVGDASVATEPQCGQCRLPMNIIPKHDAQAIVASFDSQYLHCGESDEIAAPQLGHFRVWASISRLV